MFNPTLSTWKVNQWNSLEIEPFGKNLRVNRLNSTVELNLKTEKWYRFENKLKTIRKKWYIKNEDIDSEEWKTQAEKFINTLLKNNVDEFDIEKYEKVIALLDNKEFAKEWEKYIWKWSFTFKFM